MKKTFFKNILVIMIILFGSFNSVFAEAMKLSLNALSATIENQEHYKSLNSKNTTISYTYDDDSIDFTYVIKNGETEKIYTTSFELKDDVYSYTYTKDKSDETQIKLDTIAFETVLYAVGELNALQSSFLEDINDDYSRYNFDESGIEVKTFTNAKGNVGIESFRLHTTKMSAFGTSFMPLSKEEETPKNVVAEPVAKGNEIKSLILGIVLLVVVILIVILFIKTSNINTAKKVFKKAAKKQTKAK